MQDLTLQDIDFLIESVRAWVDEPKIKAALPSVLKGLLVGGPGGNPNASEQETERVMNKADHLSSVRREQGNAVVAKLYVMRAAMVEADLGEGVE